MPIAKDKTRLYVTRKEARSQLLERIERAGDINADEVQSNLDLEQAEEVEKRWREFNSTLLSRLFTSEEYAQEYDSARRSVHVISDRYIDASLDVLAQRLVSSVKSQISTLRSIIERLGLIDEAETPIAAVEGVAQAERNLQLLIERFHLIARQMRVRHNSRPTLEIKDEYDVQDLFHALLLIFFDDVRREEWTPTYAGGASKMDYLLPALETAIEVKKTRPTLTGRMLGEELIVDIAKYQNHPQCRKLICFVFDPDGIIANPRGVETDLSKQHDKLTVRVLIVPKLHPQAVSAAISR
jgi:hypothetical protein